MVLGTLAVLVPLAVATLVAQEIARSAVGTLGLIAAVPLTTALATFAATKTTRRTAAE